MASVGSEDQAISDPANRTKDSVWIVFIFPPYPRSHHQCWQAIRGVELMMVGVFEFVPEVVSDGSEPGDKQAAEP